MFSTGACHHGIRLRLYGSLLLMAFAFLNPPPESTAGDLSVHHDLHVRLFPDTHVLEGTAVLTLYSKTDRPVEFRLAETADITAVAIDGRPAAYTFEKGRLHLNPGPIKLKHAPSVTIGYRAVFDDPVPAQPSNTDNPGYGVAGTISQRGVFLLAGAGWYPRIAADRSTFRVEITAPEGMVAVTAGRSLGHTTEGDRTVSVWEITRPVRGLSLSADRYVVRERPLKNTVAATYFRPESDYMAPKYLSAVSRHIAMYTRLFGPYPFDKFAVVENFFQTGFGFPSYTLMGGRVLRLPFIVHTSLGHEIAHCWWGNGVWVDYETGNWSEGLASYVAEHLYQERRSDAAAVDHRRQLLRNYAAHVRPDNDFPESRFQNRTDRVSQSIGYNKGAMVFHMLRRKIGDLAFWDALRDLGATRMFRTTGWADLRTAFEGTSRTDLKDFFHQWVDRPGAPRLSIADAAAQPDGSGWIVTGRIRQESPHFDLPLDLEIRTDGGTKRGRLAVNGAETPFTIRVDNRPDRLVADPAFDLFRRLDPSEMPPTVNSLKGAESVLVVAPAATGPAVKTAALLVRALGLRRTEWIDHQSLTPALVAGNDLLLIGMPKDRALLSGVPEQVSMERDAVSVNGTRYNGPADLFFGVFPHPSAQDRVAALFLPLSESEQAQETNEIAARKITHYGRYSYLAFSSGKNREKGTWPVVRSPMIVKLKP